MSRHITRDVDVSPRFGVRSVIIRNIDRCGGLGGGRGLTGEMPFSLSPQFDVFAKIWRKCRAAASSPTFDVDAFERERELAELCPADC